MRIPAILFFAMLCAVSDAAAEVTLDVFRDGGSNVVFRVINFSANAIRLPSAGYTPLNEYMPINTNPAYAIVHQPTVTVGLWLSDASERGTNTAIPPVGVWLDSLKIRTLKTGETLSLVRDPGPFQDLMQTNTNVVSRFEFNIPQEYGRQYHLWSGDLSARGPVETFNPQEKIPAGMGGDGCDVVQLLYVYDELTDADVTMQEGVMTNDTIIRLGPYPAMTRAQAIAYIEKLLHDQAGIVVRHDGTRHVEITWPNIPKSSDGGHR